MIEFDNIADWHSSLAAALRCHLPASIGAKLLASQPEFIEDAADILFEYCDRDTVIDATLAWIRDGTVAGYHGSKLTDVDVASIRKVGLIPLDARSRRTRLARALSRHHRWDDVSKKTG